ncbi:MAG: hypothetical protein GY801_45135 [bacterium]|nr:hypothetical protein [bacterium]
MYDAAFIVECTQQEIIEVANYDAWTLDGFENIHSSDADMMKSIAVLHALLEDSSSTIASRKYHTHDFSRRLNSSNSWLIPFNETFPTELTGMSGRMRLAMSALKSIGGPGGGVCGSARAAIVTVESILSGTS